MNIEKDVRSTHCYCENPPTTLGRYNGQWDLRPVIWEFLLMTSIIGDNRLACSFQYNTFF